MKNQSQETEFSQDANVVNADLAPENDNAEKNASAVEAAFAEFDQAAQTLTLQRDEFAEVAENEDSAQPPQQESAEQQSKHPGAKFIDPETATPQEVQARINFLTREAKELKEQNVATSGAYREISDALQYALQEIQQLKGKQQQSETDTAYNAVVNARQEAYERGDDAEVARLDDIILDYKVSQRMAAMQSPQPQPQAQMPQNPMQPGFHAVPKQAPHHAQQAQEYTPQQRALMEGYSKRVSQVDEQGNYKYPYLMDTHPLNERASIETVALLRQWARQGKAVHEDIDAFMDELDSQVRARSRQSSNPQAATVLSGRGSNLAENNKGAKITLTPQERKVAKSLGLSEKAYFETKQMEQEARKLRGV